MKLVLTLLAATTMATAALAQEAGGEVQPATEVVAATPESDAWTGWREVAPENLLILDTSRGRVFIEMTPEVAPNHVARIRRLAAQGFYDGQRFHRVIDWFMAQTGDPFSRDSDATMWGEGQSAYPDLVAEFTFRRGPEMAFAPVARPAGAVVGFMGSLPVQSQPDELMPQTGDGKVHGWGLYCPGVAGMARGDANDSANSQFFVMRQAYPSLDKRYTVWGRAVIGLDVVRSLAFGAEASGLVTAPDTLERVRVASDLPEAERPRVRVMATDSSAFQDLVDRIRGERGADFSICDIELPAELV